MTDAGKKASWPAFPRFSLASVLMGVTLVAILFALATSDAFSPRFAMVNSLEFSPDGKQLAFAVHQARDANVEYKNYKADISRTIGVVDLGSGSVRIIDRATALGHQGTGTRSYWYNRKSVAFGLDGSVLFVHVLGGGDVRRYDVVSGQQVGTLVAPKHDILNLASNADGTMLAAGHLSGIDFWDLTAERMIGSVDVPDTYLLHAPLLAFSADAQRLVTADSTAVRLCSFEDGPKAQVSALVYIRGSVNALAITHQGGALAFGTLDQLSIYDIDHGRFIHTFDWNDVYAMAFSPVGKKLVAADGNRAVVLDVESGQRIADVWCDGFINSLAWSPTDDLIAIGDNDGRLRLWRFKESLTDLQDVATGTERHRMAMPIVMLCLWAAFAIWLWLRAKTRASSRQIPHQPSSIGTG